MMEKVLSFEKDGILYGLDFKDVDTIIEYDQTKVTGVAGQECGMLVVRGEIIAVADHRSSCKYAIVVSSEPKFVLPVDSVFRLVDVREKADVWIAGRLASYVRDEHTDRQILLQTGEDLRKYYF